MKSGIFYIALLLVYFFISTDCLGQGADFEVVSDVGCNAFTVSVIDLSTAPPGNVVVYNYDGTIETNDTFHVYTTPGEYWIVQTVANGNPRQDSVLVRIVEPIPPQFDLANCKGTEAFVYAEDTLYNAYYVDWGDGNSEIINKSQIVQHDYGVLGTFNVSVKGLMDPSVAETDLANLNCFTSSRSITLTNDIVEGVIDRIEVVNSDSIGLSYTIDPGTAYFIEMSINDTSSFTVIDTITSGTFPNNYLVDGLNTDNNYYCFRITAFDPCDGETRPSAPGCSVLLSANAANNENQLTWQTSTSDLNFFQVNRDSIAIASTSTQQFTDTDVNCGELYCYQIIVNENNGLQSLGNISCVEAFSNDIPPPISNVNASVENGLVELNWDVPANIPSAYFITRFEQQGSNPVQFTIDTNNFTDSIANPQQRQYFYEISYENLCGNVSEEILVSPVLLRLHTNTSINWTQYLGWQGGVQAYILEIYDEEGQLLEVVDMSSDTIYTVNDFTNLPQVLIYRITALPANSGLPEVHSNFLRVVFPSSVVFPNAFTPNGDGLNDTFNFEGLFITSFRMIIYNRWGEVLFETDNPEIGWNGTVNSKLAPSDMYIFRAEFIDEAGISFVKKGEVYLLR